MAARVSCVVEHIWPERSQTWLGRKTEVAFSVETARDGSCRKRCPVVSAADTEDVFHRREPAVVVVVGGGGRARVDVRADQHAAGVAAAGGSIHCVVQRV